MRRPALLIALALPASLEAQGVRHSFSPPPPHAGVPLNPIVDSVPRRSDAALALGGALGAVGGVLVGGLVGAKVEMAGGCAGDEWCGLGGAVLGAAVGSTVLIPAAVHYANGRRGNLAGGLAASAAALGGGIAVALIANDAHTLLLVPVAQVIGAVTIEQRTSRTGRDLPQAVE